MLDAYKAMLAVAPSPQPHAEPIAWMVGTAIWWTKKEAERDAAAVSLPVVAMGPCTDPGELERCEKRLHDVAVLCANAEEERDTLRADLETMRRKNNEYCETEMALRGQLAERDALLRRIASIPGDSINYHATYMSRIARDALSASAEPSDECAHSYANKLGCPECGEAFSGAEPTSNSAHSCGLDTQSKCSVCAEPSAPAPMPEYMDAACDKFDWTPEEALHFYAEGKHFDTDNGRTRILCTGAIASHALKGMSKEYAASKGVELGAPVEIDQDALVAAGCVLRSYGLGNLSSAVEAARAALERKS
jgi:hypothetical protein